MTDVPKPITDDQYDKLSRRLWEMEQKIIVLQRATVDAVDRDMLWDKMRYIERMLIKIGTRLFKSGIKAHVPVPTSISTAPCHLNGDRSAPEPE